MNDSVISYGEIEPRVGIKSVAKLLRVGQPLMVTQRYGTMENMETRSGETVKWRRYHQFVVSTAPLSEGVPPAAQPLTKTDYMATLQQYGALCELSDRCVDLHPDNPLDVCVTRCGEQMAQVIESITIDTLKAGTNVYYAAGAASRTALASPPTRADFRLIARGFDRNDCSPITRIVSPTAMVSTMGVEPAFMAMGHTDLEPDIRNISGFKSFIEYGTPGARQTGEIGAIERFRFVLTRLFTPWSAAATDTAGQSTYLTNGAEGTGSADVYPIICVGRDAYGCVRLQGMKAAHIMVLQPGKARGGDALGQKGSVGWKTYYACAILNEQWVARLECNCTARPA